MKQREARLNVLIPSRIRWDGRWIPATVRNISAHGVALRLPQPPRPGTYVEIQVGPVSVAARTVWAGDQACGLHSREAFDLTALSAARANNSAVRISPSDGQQPARYRPSLSAREQHERSQAMASLFQYAFFAAVVFAAAMGAGWEVYQTLSAPIQNIQSALGPTR